MFAATVLSVHSTAHASLMSPEVEAAFATYLAWFILIVMPIAGIVLFWLVHILPEKVAEKRHHPQKDAIQVLYSARTTRLRVQSEQLAQRVNLHLALGGAFDEGPAIPVATR